MEECLGETIRVNLSTSATGCCGSRELVIFFDCDRDTYRCADGHWIGEKFLPLIREG
jgi:hypothetical protein